MQKRHPDVIMAMFFLSVFVRQLTHNQPIILWVCAIIVVFVVFGVGVIMIVIVFAICLIYIIGFVYIGVGVISGMFISCVVHTGVAVGI
jgi:hypothetical protein